MPQFLTRRDFLKTVACAAAASLCAAPPFAQGQGAPGYNVLWLMSDEHSPHAVGAYGNTVVKTPTLDDLARRGVAFTAAYCQDPICVPSRASFLTGRTPSKVGVFNNGGGLDNTVPTLADVFKKAGYAAGWVGKTHWGGKPDFESMGTKGEAKKAAAKGREPGQEINSSRLPEDAKVVEWPAAAEGDSIARDQALQFLQENRARRFFLGVSFVKPHFPFLVQKEYYEPYQGKLDCPTVTPRMIEELPQSSRIERERYGFAKLTDDQIRHAREIYYGMVTYVDDLLGSILKKLDALGLRERTIVLYTADHGEMGGEHGLWYKNSFYDAAVRVPFFWSFPKELPQGKVVGAPVMNMDIFPTLCDLCGLPKPDGLEGRSLLPLMKGAEDGKDRVAFSENFRNNMAARMIRTDRWKYCYFHEDREQLFDMRNDPGEITNLVEAPEHRALVRELREKALAGWPLQEFLNRKKKGAVAAGDDESPAAGKKAARAKTGAKGKGRKAGAKKKSAQRPE